jgi:hypothetical protein
MYGKLTGDEDSKLITSFRVCDAGSEALGRSDETVFNLAIAPDFLTPGLVTFAKLAMDGWLAGISPVVFTRLAAFGFGAALLVSFAATALFGLLRDASQSCTFSGTPTLTIDSKTQTLIGLHGSNFVGPRF